ncbi:MAG: hypothetical protein WKG07_33085 [Hymenobacter sp.]
MAAGASTSGRPIPTPAGPRTCATQQADAYQQAQLQKRLPGYRTEKRTVGRLSRTALGAAAATTYTLPVVVHIISDGEPVGTGTNLSQKQIQTQLDVLNEDYRNRNANGASVPAPSSRCGPMRRYSSCWPSAAPMARLWPSRALTA